MLVEELVAQCDNWDGSREQFSKIVSDYIYEIDSETHARICKLADEFEAIPGTPRKWAAGTSHPRIQKQIIAFIRENIQIG